MLKTLLNTLLLVENRLVFLCTDAAVDKHLAGEGHYARYFVDHSHSTRQTSNAAGRCACANSADTSRQLQYASKLSARTWLNRRHQSLMLPELQHLCTQLHYNMHYNLNMGSLDSAARQRPPLTSSTASNHCATDLCATNRSQEQLASLKISGAPKNSSAPLIDVCNGAAGLRIHYH